MVKATSEAKAGKISYHGYDNMKMYIDFLFL